MIFVAIPAHDGKIGIETVRALLNERAIALGAGEDLRFAFLPGCSLITQARNQLAADFMASDCDRLMFIDSDVSWEPGDLLKLAHRPQDVVGGAYRFKEDDEGYPVLYLDKPELYAVDGLLEVASLPGGFLAISRSALDKLTAAMPHRAYSQHGQDFQGFFHAPIFDGCMFGEDAAFCTDWRAIGGQVWLDPELALTHHDGRQAYRGRIGDWLRGRMKEAA